MKTMAQINLFFEGRRGTVLLLLLCSSTSGGK
jgi:hypothetical protein